MSGTLYFQKNDGSYKKLCDVEESLPIVDLEPGDDIIDKSRFLNIESEFEFRIDLPVVIDAEYKEVEE